MRVFATLVARYAAAVVLLLPSTLLAQGLAQRIARAPDGAIRLTFATRPEVCGDGTFIGEDTPRGFRMYSFRENGYSSETLEDVQPECRTGPLRLVVTKSGNQVIDLNAAVGVSWRTTTQATDLGTVPAAEAASWLLDLALKDPTDRIQLVAFVAANAADSARIADRLFRMARDRNLIADTRARSVRWLAEAARHEGRSAEADNVLRGIVRDATDVRTVRDRAIRELVPSSANDAFLKETYRAISEPSLKERIIRTIGASHSDQSAAWMRAIIVDRQESRDLRERALRTFGEELRRSAEIRALYPSLDDVQLKDRALRVVVESGDSTSNRWLREVAVDAREPIAARERAIRVLGEASGADVNGWLETLVNDRAQPVVLRERALRMLAERGQATFLKQAYGRLEDVELKDRALRLVAERNAADAREWLVSVVMNVDERDDLRDRALRLVAEQGASTAELVALYDKVPTASLRQRLVRIFAERGDDVAVGKLIAIADRDPDPDTRRTALRRLSETKNPKARSFLENRLLR